MDIYWRSDLAARLDICTVARTTAVDLHVASLDKLAIRVLPRAELLWNCVYLKNFLERWKTPIPGWTTFDERPHHEKSPEGS